MKSLLSAVIMSFLLETRARVGVRGFGAGANGRQSVVGGCGHVAATELFPCSRSRETPRVSVASVIRSAMTTYMPASTTNAATAPACSNTTVATTGTTAPPRKPTLTISDVPNARTFVGYNSGAHSHKVVLTMRQKTWNTKPMTRIDGAAWANRANATTEAAPASAPTATTRRRARA